MTNKTVKTLAEWDGRTPNNPNFDWWKEEFVQQIGGIVFHKSYDFSTSRWHRSRIETVDHLLSLGWLDDDDMETCLKAMGELDE